MLGERMVGTSLEKPQRHVPKVSAPRRPDLR
jgi:hypothetical protein